MRTISTYSLVFLTLLFSTFSIDVVAQEEEPKPGIIQLKKARNKFLGNDYKGAMVIYEDLYRTSPNHPEVNYRIGEIHFTMKQYPEALPYLEKAYQVKKDEDEDLPYLLGQVYHRLGKLDEADKVFSEMLSDEDQSEENRIDADRMKKQVHTARELLANPVPVKIVNMGERINSPFNEYGPSISADGKTLTFTARKPDTKGGGVEINDGQFYEDIYLSTWNEEEGNWNYAAPVPGRLNTEYHDASLSLAPDGKQIFIYKNTKDTRSGDIYVSRLMSSGKWTSPDALPNNINSSYFESSASLSADGKWLYFVSERKGGHGLGDIYRSKKISRSEWSDPENLGPVINTPEDEIAVFLHPDGKTLFFSSKGHSTMGGYDIFRSIYENGKWSAPENLGYPINTLGDDLHFTLSTDNQIAFYTNELPGSLGGRDIYSIDLTEYAVLEKDWKRKTGSGLSILKGSIYDTDAAQAMEVELTIKDNEGNVIGTTNSNIEGEYFITLKGGQEYTLSLNIPGFESLSENVFLPVDEKGTFTLVKHFLVNRKEKSMQLKD